jgi:hypothetical protein
MSRVAAKSEKLKWASEAELCAAFIAHIGSRHKDWDCYPETADWDILVVNRLNGLQVGVEAKLELNIRVLEQATDRLHSRSGPDYRAVLVPYGKTEKLAGLARLLGVTVITGQPGVPNRNGYIQSAGYMTAQFHPSDLPYPALHPSDYIGSEWQWFEWPVLSRHNLPDYIPDVTAGVSGPTKLTEWKARAIKISILMERRGSVSASDFDTLKISISRWRQGGWIIPGPFPKTWKRGDYCPDFRAQHPTNYGQFEADFDKWAPKQVQTTLFDGGSP